MKMLYKTFLFIAVCCLIFLSSGCGYKIGVRGMMHPQIKSVAIAPIRNNTMEPLASDVLRMQLAAEFQRDGALKLERLSKADCIVYATIESSVNKTIDNASFDGGVTYNPEKFRLTINVKYKIVIPGTGTVLVPDSAVDGYANYEVLSDPATAKASALKFACFHAAQKIVTQTTEAW